MYANGNDANNEKFNDNSQLITTNYAYDKLNQLSYQQRYFWSWQLFIIFFIILIIVNALIILCLTMNHQQSDNKMTNFCKFIPLNDYQKRTLATFKLQRPLLSVDTNNNLLILSSFKNYTNELFVEQLALDDFQNGFISANIKFINGMKNCQQLSSIVYCCHITMSDNNSIIGKGTHCFRQSPLDVNAEISTNINYTDHFYMRNMQMTAIWQTLSNDETIILLQNITGKYNMFNTKNGILMPILDNEDYANLTPVASFFGMDNAEELTQLAQDDYKFYICEYLRDSKHRFLLQECYQTALIKLEKFSHIKFCANPIYQAVIQFNNVYKNVKWELQVSYTSTNEIIDNNIYIVDSVDLITDKQITMICSPFIIDIYFISNNILVHYAIDLH